MTSLKEIARRIAPDHYAAAKVAREELRERRARALPTAYGFKLAGSDFQACGFEEAELALAASILDERTDVFVDIGANVGLYTLLALGKGVPVIAVEPSQKNLRRLRRNLQLNGHENVSVFPVALAREAGVLGLYNEETGASLIPGWAGGQLAATELVPVLTLDQVFKTADLRDQSVFVKMDVEGAEVEVLAGATEVLDREPDTIWLIEVNLDQHHPGGRHPAYEAAFAPFFSRGYECLDAITGDRVSEQAVSERARSGAAYPSAHNFLFVRSQSERAVSTSPSEHERGHSLP